MKSDRGDNKSRYESVEQEEIAKQNTAEFINSILELGIALSLTEAELAEACAAVILSLAARQVYPEEAYQDIMKIMSETWLIKMHKGLAYDKNVS